MFKKLRYNINSKIENNFKLDNYFTELAGVPVHYDRLPPPYDYGTKGKPIRFYATEGFQEKLDRCFEEIWILCPFGRAEVITSAGAYTNKSGWHGKGLAMDLDGIFWIKKNFIANRYLEDTSFYLGVNAILLKHFSTVLNYHYDSAHKDHFHIQDDGNRVDFKKSPSTLFFLQAVLRHLFGQDVCIDGECNKGTETVLMRALENFNIGRKLNDREIWLKFMTRIAKRAFESI